MSNKGLMIVLNDIVRDNRVLKMAAAMRRVYSDFILIGTFKTNKPFAQPESSIINGLNCLRFPNYSKSFKVNPELPPEEQNLLKHKHAVSRFVDDITAFAETWQPGCIHTHDMYSLPIGDSIKRQAAAAGREITWIHDVHEFASGSEHMPPLFQSFALDLEERFLCGADRVLTVTKELRAELRKRYAELPPIQVIYNTPPIRPVSAISTTTIRKSLSLGDQPIAVYAGQVKERRGVERMIPILERIPSLHYAIMTLNGGPYPDMIRKRAAEAGVADRVHWLPYVEPTQVAAFVSDASFGVIPIENYGNAEVALPNKLFDYVFAGLPTLSHSLKAIETFFAEHKVGEVADFDDPDAAAQAASRILARPLAPEFEEEKKRIIAEYAWESQERRLVGLYLEALGFAGSEVIDAIGGGVPKMTGVRVLHGITGAAGQPGTLARELNRKRGITAKSLQITIPKFGYEADLFYPVRSTDASTMMDVLSSVVDHFDVFHLHTRGFAFDRTDTSFPTGADLLLLRAAGKAVFVHFRGSEARLQSEFERLSPFNYVADDTEKTLAKFPEHAKVQYIELVSAIADRILVTDPEMQSYVPNSTIVERAIDLRKWEHVGIEPTDCPLIVHAPSRRGVKGTEAFLMAVEALKRKGLRFDVQLVEGMTHKLAMEQYRKADVIVDQLRIGWYGVLAIEAMALGKPVVSYVRDDLVGHFGKDVPIAIANPDTVEAVLDRLIRSYRIRSRIAKAGRAYCERVHSAEVVADQLARLYREVLNGPRQIETQTVIRHLKRQSALIIAPPAQAASAAATVDSESDPASRPYIALQKLNVVKKNLRQRGVIWTVQYLGEKAAGLVTRRFRRTR